MSVIHELQEQDRLAHNEVIRQRDEARATVAELRASEARLLAALRWAEREMSLTAKEDYGIEPECLAHIVAARAAIAQAESGVRA